MRTEDPLYRDPSTAKDAARLFERAARAIATLDHPVLAPSTIRACMSDELEKNRDN